MNQRAFTITETIIVVVVIGILAVFGTPQYQKAIRKSQERNIVIHLKMIHAANEIYKSNDGAYLPAATTQDIDFINSNLGLNIIADGIDYQYVSDGGTYTTEAIMDDGAGGDVFKIQLVENPLSSTNPCCVSGCLLVTACP